MNLKELAGLMGKQAFIVCDGLKVKVTIKDFKTAFGRIDARIQSEETEKWVDFNRLNLIN